MKVLTILMVLLLSSGFCLAAEPKKDEPQEKVKEQDKIRQEQKLEPDDKRDKQGPAWPRPFQPREEVSADSVVPFPADI